MGNKTLERVNMQASVQIGAEVKIPMNDSVIFGRIDNDEMYIMIRHKNDPSNEIKIFLRETTEIIEESDTNKNESDTNKN